MSTADERFAQQDEAFRAQVPALMKTALRNRWVIYLDGVQGDFDTEIEAYRTALARYGIDAGFVIAQVAPQEPILMTAAFAYAFGQ